MGSKLSKRRDEDAQESKLAIAKLHRIYNRFLGPLPGNVMKLKDGDAIAYLAHIQARVKNINADNCNNKRVALIEPLVREYKRRKRDIQILTGSLRDLTLGAHISVGTPGFTKKHGIIVYICSSAIAKSKVSFLTDKIEETTLDRFIEGDTLWIYLYDDNVRRTEDVVSSARGQLSPDDELSSNVDGELSPINNSQIIPIDNSQIVPIFPSTLEWCRSCKLKDPDLNPPITTPQSKIEQFTIMNLLPINIDDLDLQLDYYEMLNDPDSTDLMIDSVNRIKISLASQSQYAV
jgi:hypothetical protein